MADQLLAAAREAERFIAGFEGDPLQEGIDKLLTDLRAAIAAPADAPRQMFMVVSGRLNTMFVHGVFPDRESADIWASRADKYRGKMHPFSPHRVEPIKVAPALLPDMDGDAF